MPLLLALPPKSVTRSTFEHTKRPVPIGGAAAVWWFTNYQVVNDEMPKDLMSLFDEPRKLRQGKKEVSEQFGYDSKGTDSGSMTAHFASFRFSFAICAFVADDENLIRPPDGGPPVTFYRPGWLKDTQSIYTGKQGWAYPSLFSENDALVKLAPAALALESAATEQIGQHRQCIILSFGFDGWMHRVNQACAGAAT